jgi:hypothetical protein
MEEFLVVFSGGEYDDFYEYMKYFTEKSRDDLEYKLLECNKSLPGNLGSFEDFIIYGVEEWKTQNLIKL